MKVIVLLNAAAGSAGDGGDIVRTLESAFAAAGIEARIEQVGPGELAEAARRAAGSSVDAVVVGGGDGTISTVAEAMAGNAKPLGILPLGTLNHFSKDLKIPAEIALAVGVIAAGHVTAVDVAEVNGKIFINNSSIGIYPRAVRRRDGQQERLGRGKWLAMLLAVISVFRRFPLMTVQLMGVGEPIHRRTPFVFVGNNIYELSLFNLGGRAALDQGKLCVYVARRTTRRGIIVLALRAIFGVLSQSKDFDSLCVSELRIETQRRRLLVAMDGEVTAMTPPLHYRVRSRALRVFVQRSVEET